MPGKLNAPGRHLANISTSPKRCIENIEFPVEGGIFAPDHGFDNEFHKIPVVGTYRFQGAWNDDEGDVSIPRWAVTAVIQAQLSTIGVGTGWSQAGRR